MNFNWQGKVILVAEDEPANYLFIEKVIESTNATVIHADNGLEAINCIKTNPSIDLVLMDIHMPELDGYEAANAIKAINPDLPIIMQTCHTVINTERLETVTFDDFVQKPINITKLLVMINKHLTLSYSC